jgi:epoxyqueuosine reductase QueG
MDGSTLTNQIKSFGLEAGLDLIGVCSVKSLPAIEMLDHQENIKQIMPTAKHVIVGASRMIPSAVEASSRNIRFAQFSTMGLYQELNRISYQICKFLDDLGFLSVAVPTFLPIDMHKNYGIVSDVSLRHAAVEAGLGTLGTSRLILTDEYGPRVRLMAILTNAPLKVDRKSDVGYCDGCELCVEHCPADAISTDGTVDIRRCSRVVLRYALPGLVRFARGLTGASRSELKDAFRDAEFAEYWQNLSTGIFYSCAECVSVCPVGKS